MCNRIPWAIGGPINPKCTVVCGSWWLTREIELSTARAALISFTGSGNDFSASWTLPASKTDPMAFGVTREHGCAWQELKDRPSTEVPTPDAATGLTEHPYVVNAVSSKCHNVGIGALSLNPFCWESSCGWKFGRSPMSQRTSQLPQSHQLLCEKCFPLQRSAAKAKAFEIAEQKQVWRTSGQDALEADGNEPASASATEKGGWEG